MQFDGSLIVALIALAALSYGYLPGLAFLVCALMILVSSLVPTLSLSNLILLTALAISFPLVGYATGLLLDRASLRNSRDRFFGVLGLATCLLIIIDSGELYEYLAASVRLTTEHDHAGMLALFLSLTSAAVFCAGLAGFSLMVIQLLFELPVRWILSAAQVESGLSIEAVRPLLILFFVSLTLHLLSGLFVAELWPSRLLL